MQRSIQIGQRAYDITSDDEYLARMGPVFEPDMTAVFEALIEPGAVVYDIGANIGMTALLFSQRASQVVAFEPAPSTHALLKGNLEAAGAGNVTPLNLGLGDREERQTITFSEKNRSGGFVSDKLKLATGHRTEDITVTTLDAILGSGSQPLPGFIKMDVEGFEPRVLRGGRELIETARPTAVLELNHFCLNVMHRVALPDFFDQLRAIFPVLVAVDKGNKALANLHQPDAAYSVMIRHVTGFSFPNIVAGFDQAIHRKLAALVPRAGG